MSNAFFIKRGDRAPSLIYRLSPTIDLTGATVVFNMKTQAGVAVLTRAAAAIDGNPTLGVLRYDWGPSDTAAVGTYDAEFEVTLPGAIPATFPNYGFITVRIAADLG